MFEIPVNVPVDTVKLRIEKTVIRRIPTEAFYYLVDLRYLWVTYNCVANIDISSFYNLKQLHELRLDGNLISTFPWESLTEMPNLRTLDLHNNKMTSIPAEAGRYLRNLTYLDISSNKLTTLPSELMDIWPPFSEVVPPKSTDILATQRVILGMLMFYHSLLKCAYMVSWKLEQGEMGLGFRRVLVQAILLACSAIYLSSIHLFSAVDRKIYRKDSDLHVYCYLSIIKACEMYWIPVS